MPYNSKPPGSPPEVKLLANNLPPRLPVRLLKYVTSTLSHPRSDLDGYRRRKEATSLPAWNRCSPWNSSLPEVDRTHQEAPLPASGPRNRSGLQDRSPLPVVCRLGTAGGQRGWAISLIVPSVLCAHHPPVYLVSLFEDTNLAAIHAKRVTVCVYAPVFRMHRWYMFCPQPTPRSCSRLPPAWVLLNWATIVGCPGGIRFWYSM